MEVKILEPAARIWRKVKREEEEEKKSSDVNRITILSIKCQIDPEYINSRAIEF